MRSAGLTSIAAAIGLAFAPAFAGAMSKDELKSARKGIEADYQAAKAGCAALRANTKDICRAEAKGRETVALAELDARYEPSHKSRYEVRVARGEADYAVAKERCDDLGGNQKAVCVKEAKAAQTAVKADATAQLKTADANRTAGAKIMEARQDAAIDKRDAGYAVAKEKCDPLAGTAKDQCVADAKARYGKS